tara:strand:- start:132 stop:713 length:582 start_codon:yes stop_codon:yes gene_type:complete
MKGIIISGSNTIKREIVPSGTHIAVCYSMIHIGNVEWEYQGEKKISNKVRLSFELSNELREFGDIKKPLVISKEYTLSLHEKSNLRKDLESWRGVAFTNNDLRNFDLTNLLGISCMISIIHKTSNSGSDYALIGNVSALTKGIEIPKQFNKNFIFNYNDNFNEIWLEDQPDWIQEQIKSTEDYQNKITEIDHM